MNNNKIYKSTSEYLLINDNKFPPLESYAELRSELEMAYINWLKNDVLEINNHICYLDLTFETPDLKPTTISITSNECIENAYRNLMNEFILGGNTLYSHDFFQKGLVDKTDNTSLEKFLFYENKEVETNTKKMKPKTNDFHPGKIDLDEIILKAESKYPNFLEKINKVDIDQHWSAWVDINLKYKESLKSNYNGKLKWILLVPVGYRRSENKFKLIGGIFIGMDNLCTFNDVINFTRSVIIKVISASDEYHEKISILNSIKSAKAAIMARNMSHNIGSHVMHYLKDQLYDIESLLKSNSLSNIIENENDKNYALTLHESIINIVNGESLENSLTLEKIVQSNIELPFLIGLGRFINYIQERQDYIATISTGYVPYQLKINFKDAVYDEINYDYKVLRHQDKESFKYQYCENILLDNIIKSEGLKRQNIIIKYKNFNGLNDEVRDYLPPKIRHLNKPFHKQDFDDLNDINILLPGGTVGRHALFSIMENVLRNSAKHNSLKDLSDLEITLKIEKNKNYPNLVELSIWDNLNCYEKAKDIIKLAINDSYVDESGELNENYKGIKEMRISAAWLRNINELNEEKISPPLLQLINVDGNVGYKLFLLKPKELLIISNYNLSNQKTKDFMVNEGWDIKNLECSLKDNDYSYRFIVIDKHLFEEITKKYKQSDKNFENIIHSRFISINPTVLKEKLDLLNRDDLEPEKFYNDFYEQYVNEKLVLESLPEIYIEDDKVKENNKDEDRIKLFFSENSTSDVNNKIVFKTHLDNAKSYDDFFEKNKNNWKYIESITGNTSTDRIIRKSDLNTKWYLEIVESALTKVLIFDERIWSHYSGFEDKDIKFPISDSEKEEIKKIYDANTDNDKKINELKKFLSARNIFSESLDTYNFHEFLNKDYLDFEIFYGINKCNEKTTKILSAKGIYVYSIIAKEGELYVVGTETNEPLCKLDDSETFFKDKFHFICIHQGLLDKIYNNKNLLTSNKRVELLKSFNRRFNAEKLIVHSGRSRPPKKDLPTSDPFIQYSALSHAIKDCKFSLTELLFSARYE